MQMLVDKHSCEELVGKLFGSFYEKHLKVFTDEGLSCFLLEL